MPESEIIWTIGHSNRSFEDFCALLIQNQLKRLVDVRRYPSSRYNPQFNAANLRTNLVAVGIDYQHVEALGGMRGKTPDITSRNLGWNEGPFRNYADYATASRFRQALSELISKASSSPTAIMCAEKNWRDCHRQIISDYLIAREWRVFHIIDTETAELGTLTPGAEVLPEFDVVYPRTQPRQAEFQF